MGQDYVIANVLSRLLYAAAQDCGKPSNSDKQSLYHISSRANPGRALTLYCTAFQGREATV